MADLRNTSTGGLAKYIVPVIAMVKQSMGVPKGVTRKKLKTSVKANNVLVKNIDANEKALLDWQNLADKQGTEGDAKNLVLETDKGDVLFGQLWKPNVNINMGDMAEGVFAAAITARFKSKNRPITTTDVFDVLKAFKANGTKPTAGKKGLKGVITFDSPNNNEKVIDKVTLTIALAEVNMVGLLNKDYQPSLMTVARGAVAYANGTIVMANAEKVYMNDIFNQINVVADGLSGQRETKVDVYVEIGDEQNKPKRVDINVSLKAQDVKQFGQVGGHEFEKQITLWTRLLGSSYKTVVGGIKTKYEELLAANDPIKALTLSYTTVKDKLQTDLYDDALQGKIMENMAEGITYFATRGDFDVSLVQLTGGDAKIYAFEGLQEKLKQEKFRVSMKYSVVTRGAQKGRELPTVVITKRSTTASPNDEDFLQIRTKIEYKGSDLYFRNYVEKLKHLGNLVSTYA